MSLFDAIHNHDIEECERLAKLKVDFGEVHFNNKNWCLNPLGLALLYGYDDIVIVLRQHGYREIGPDCVDIFVEKNLIALVRLYLEHTNENPNYLCKDGNSLLGRSILNKNLQMAKLLLDYGADCNYINTNGKSLLHLAVELDDPRFVKLLLKYEANPNIKDLISDQTPLCSVSIREEYNPKIIKLLMKHGAIATASFYNSKGKHVTPFKLMIKRQKHEEIDFVMQAILERKINNHLLVLLSREFDAGSLIHRDYLPLDMFRLIFHGF